MQRQKQGHSTAIKQYVGATSGRTKALSRGDSVERATCRLVGVRSQGEGGDCGEGDNAGNRATRVPTLMSGLTWIGRWGFGWKPLVDAAGDEWPWERSSR